MCEFPSRTRHEPSEAYCSHNKPGKSFQRLFKTQFHSRSRQRSRRRRGTHNRVRRYYGRLLMCKRTMYKRARIPMFLWNDAHAPTVVPRPFFLAPAKTAWERGYLGSRPSPFTHAYISKRMRYLNSGSRTGKAWA